jgi:predicted aldo/keto reductase-like oxidoreductase
MIAHRLSTIQTAENLLFLKDQRTVEAAEKGSPEYEKLIERLKETNYRH